MSDEAVLTDLAQEVRFEVLEMAARAQTPHVAGALSCVETLVALYFGGTFRLSRDSLLDGTADTVVFSKGHAISALYAVLSQVGLIDKSELLTYNVNGGRLPEQPAANQLPGVFWATGSLGHGLSVGLGVALGRQRQGDSRRVIVLVSDGECQEGSFWEALALASHHRLDNLLLLVDANGWQATDRVSNVTNIYPLEPKFRAFDWQTSSVDGRSASRIGRSIEALMAQRGRPSALIVNTLKGQGIFFMEDDNNWHYRSPTSDELLLARNHAFGISQHA